MFPEQVRILSISDHESVKLSRELLLQSVGYSVISMSSDCGLKEELPRHVNIAIIGHTVDDRSAIRIVGRLRTAQPHLRILRLAEKNAFTGCEYDSVCFPEHGPRAFLDSVAELLEAGEAVEDSPIFGHQWKEATVGGRRALFSR